jgi:acyl carrier protein
MISKTAIADKVLAIMASELKRDVNSLSLDQRLKEDLELNSLDAIELVFRFEGDFDLSIPDEDVEKLATIGDIVNYVETRLAERG